MWRHAAGLCALSLGLATGCAEEFGKEGRIDRAIEKDLKALVPKRCTDRDLKRYCGDEKKGSKLCRDNCGE